MLKRVVLGTVQFGLNYGINNKSGQPSENNVFEILQQAFESGIHILDSAAVYGNAQEIIGRFHKAKNICFDINTKFIATSPQELRTELAQSLDQLGVKKIHTYFYHRFEDYSKYPALLEELVKIKNEKQVGQIGVSIYTNDEFETVINDDIIDVIQIPFNLLDNAKQRGELLKKAKQKNKTIQARSVFLQGLFFADIQHLQAELLPLKPYLEKMHAVEKQSALPMEVLCLQYAASQPEIDEIIIGVDTKQQLLNNIHSLQAGLPGNIQQEIDAVDVKEINLLYPFNWNKK